MFPRLGHDSFLADPVQFITIHLSLSRKPQESYTVDGFLCLLRFDGNSRIERVGWVCSMLRFCKRT
jgi:hypothetical protein